MMTFRSQAFCNKYQKNHLGFKVSNIAHALAFELSCSTTIVVLSEETLVKNLKHHPDLKENDYLKLEEIIGKSNFILKDGLKMIAVALQKDELYHYALKATKSGKAIFLTSFRITRSKDIERLRKKAEKGNAKILKDNLP
jgi:hypothetical protein